MDVKGILRAVGLEAVVKFTLLICEEGLLKAAEATKYLGKPIRYYIKNIICTIFNSFCARSYCKLK